LGKRGGSPAVRPRPEVVLSAEASPGPLPCWAFIAGHGFATIATGEEGG